jgi:hypothetical protein
LEQFHKGFTKIKYNNIKLGRVLWKR